MIEACKRHVKLELARCQRNLDRGGSPGFWLWRLRPVLAELADMTAAVRLRVERLEVSQTVSHPPASNAPEPENKA